MTNIALDVHSHLVPVFQDRLAEINGVECRDDKIWIDGHGIDIPAIYRPENLSPAAPSIASGAERDDDRCGRIRGATDAPSDGSRKMDI